VHIKYIFYNVQDYSVLNNNDIRPVMCEPVRVGILHDRIISLNGMNELSDSDILIIQITSEHIMRGKFG
jgi:hypothetical protein